MGIADFVKNKLQLAPNFLTLPLLHLNRFGDKVYGRRCREFKRDIPNIDPEQKLLDMVNYAIRHVPYYRKRYAGMRINSVEEFRTKIGFIDKQEVCDNPEDFISDEAELIPHVTLSTSGTTGKPLRMLMPSDRYVTEMAFVGRILEHSGWRYGIKGAIRRQQLPNGKDFIVNPVTKEIIFDGYRTDRAYLEKMVKVMRRHGVDTLYGYVSTITQLLHMFRSYAIDTGFFRRAILTSEAVLPSHYSFIEDELGIKIVTFYGHTEKLILIEQLDRDTLTIEPGYGFTEIIGEDGSPVKAGEEGELVGTTFYNRVMPLIRYRTGDYTTPTGKTTVVDGIAKPTVSSISGRRDKSIIYRHDGSYTPACAFEIHDEHRMSFEAIQYVQERRGYLKVLVVKGDRFNPADEEYMLAHYGHAMSGRQYVTIEYVDRLITQPNGKTLTVINKTL